MMTTWRNIIIGIGLLFLGWSLNVYLHRDDRTEGEIVRGRCQSIASQVIFDTEDKTRDLVRQVDLANRCVRMAAEQGGRR